MVEKEQEMGKSGQTGLAGGDHLHFTMLVSGQMVNPIEWWDQHWIQDRIIRKLQEAGGGTTTKDEGPVTKDHEQKTKSRRRRAR
jgi:hypothetical protein